MEIAITLTDANFDREVNNSEKPVLVDFWAEWCGPCKLIAPLIEEIAREKGDAIKVGKVNIDENQNLSFKFNIRAIPTLLIFKNGQVRDQVTGMTSKKDLVGRIDALAWVFALRNTRVGSAVDKSGNLRNAVNLSTSHQSLSL